MNPHFKARYEVLMAQIKSKERVRNLAEVYTNEREVKAMLDLIPTKNEDEIISLKFLEPACGNGNFLVEILKRKLARVNEKYGLAALSIYEFYIIRSLTTIYGIDICEENIVEARERIFVEVKANFDTHKGSYLYSQGFLPCVKYVLEKNITLGDSINSPEKIEFIDFKVKGKRFEQRSFNYADLVLEKPKVQRVIPPEHYSEIGRRYQIETGTYYEGNQRHLEFV